MGSISESVVVILGASGNLGQACAGRFREQGADLVLVDRSMDALNESFSDYSVEKTTLVGCADLLDEGAVRELAGMVEEKFGRIDVLVNTVGAFRGGNPVQDEPMETWDMLIGVNLFASLIPSREVVPVMLRNGRGRIVNVVSRHALQGAPNYAAYSAAKAALLRFSESLAAELKASSDITVNCVIPGTIDTPQNRQAMPDADATQWVSGEAIADVVSFLASDAARAITGAAIPVYGKS